MIIGAHARDRIVHDRAGLELSRATRDLDLAIAVPSMPEFHALTQDLQPVGVTAISFLVQGHHVDLIPFGGIETITGSILETSDGILTDVTGKDIATDLAAAWPACHRRGATPDGNARPLASTTPHAIRNPRRQRNSHFRSDDHPTTRDAEHASLGRAHSMNRCRQWRYST